MTPLLAVHGGQTKGAGADVAGSSLSGGGADPNNRPNAAEAPRAALSLQPSCAGGVMRPCWPCSCSYTSVVMTTCGNLNGSSIVACNRDACSGQTIVSGRKWCLLMSSVTMRRTTATGFCPPSVRNTLCKSPLGSFISVVCSAASEFASPRKSRTNWMSYLSSQIISTLSPVTSDSATKFVHPSLATCAPPFCNLEDQARTRRRATASARNAGPTSL